MQTVKWIFTAKGKYKIIKVIIVNVWLLSYQKKKENQITERQFKQ